MFFIVMGLFIETLQKSDSDWNSYVPNFIKKTKIVNFLFEKALKIKTDSEKPLVALFNKLKANHKNKANSFVGRKQQWDTQYG